MTRAFDPRTYRQYWERKPIGDGALPESGVSCDQAALGVRLNPAAQADGRRRVPQGAGVLDEIPGAYKHIDAVMAAQADLVEVVHTLKQIICIKG